MRHSKSTPPSMDVPRSAPTGRSAKVPTATPEGASHSDIADLWHLPGAGYCDVAFVDKRTSEALRKGKYDKIPKRNSEFAAWLRHVA